MLRDLRRRSRKLEGHFVIDYITLHFADGSERKVPSCLELVCEVIKISMPSLRACRCPNRNTLKCWI